MADYKGSKTEKNLWTAFAGESQARNKYEFFASQAQKEGYQQIAALFMETANNEKAHGKMWFKELAGLGGGVGDTAANLKAAAAGEDYEWTTMYKQMAKDADERYQKLLKRVESETVFKEEKPTIWRCRNCGFLYEAEEAPEKCPCCDHPKAFFERVEENY